MNVRFVYPPITDLYPHIVSTRVLKSELVLCTIFKRVCCALKGDKAWRYLLGGRKRSELSRFGNLALSNSDAAASTVASSAVSTARGFA